MSDYPMKKRMDKATGTVWSSGPSGEAKFYPQSYMQEQYYEQRRTYRDCRCEESSYQGLCSLIRQKTKGRDGIYFTYQEDAPVAFNPFLCRGQVYDVEKRESLKALLLT
ncbi:MAG: TraG family conjugative transposon ATPase, partial [Alistipes putredinis]